MDAGMAGLVLPSFGDVTLASEIGKGRAYGYRRRSLCCRLRGGNQGRRPDANHGAQPGLSRPVGLPPSARRAFPARPARCPRPGQTGSISPSARIAWNAGHERRQPPRRNRIAQALHQHLIVMQVVPGQQHRADDLVRLHHMMQIGARIAAAGGAAGSRRPAGAGRPCGGRCAGSPAPARVQACPVRPEREGSTQSIMSMPRSTAPTMSSGLPTPIR